MVAPLKTSTITTELACTAIGVAPVRRRCRGLQTRRAAQAARTMMLSSHPARLLRTRRPLSSASSAVKPPGAAQRRRAVMVCGVKQHTGKTSVCMVSPRPRTLHTTGTPSNLASRHPGTPCTLGAVEDAAQMSAPVARASRAQHAPRTRPAPCLLLQPARPAHALHTPCPAL